MTLILGLVSNGCVLQVSDRLITKQNGGAFDPISNKSILYVAPDAVVTMAYTGTAYLEGIPTDQWIAELISGKRLKPGPFPLSPLATCLGKLPRWLHIGPTLRLIEERLTSAFASSPMRNQARKARFGLQVAGWQGYRRKRARPILATIMKEYGLGEFKVSRANRHIHGKLIFADMPDGFVKPSDRDALCDAMRAARTIDEVERLLVDTIRMISHRSILVGADCMSVWIPPPGVRQVRTRYIPHKHREGALVSGSPPRAVHTFPATFSPWVIGPGLIQPPSVGTSGNKLHTGNFEVLLEGPESENEAPEGKGVRLISASGGMQRPREPQ